MPHVGILLLVLPDFSKRECGKFGLCDPTTPPGANPGPNLNNSISGSFGDAVRTL
jgi:hypothetical protein